MNSFIGICFDQVREDELYYSINVLVTSKVSMQDEELIHQYHELTYIEGAFLMHFNHTEQHVALLKENFNCERYCKELYVN